MESLKLADLKPGKTAVLAGYGKADPAYRKRLLAMGLTRGVSLRLIKVAPLGDPVEIEVRGYRLSLRKKEAEILELRSDK